MSTKAQSKLRKLPYHVERLYALVRAVGDKTEMCYLLQPNVKDLYATVVKEEWLGTGHTVQSLRDAGWVAHPVMVYEK